MGFWKAAGDCGLVGGSLVTKWETVECGQGSRIHRENSALSRLWKIMGMTLEGYREGLGNKLDLI